MAANKKEFALGVGLMVVFLVVLVLIFLPLINGHNAMEYMDNMYNSISKGSAYYIPNAIEEAETLKGKTVETSLTLASEVQAERTAILFQANGATASAQGDTVQVSGDLGALLLGSLEDADRMYYNDGGALVEKYGYDERAALYNWWSAFKALDKYLKKESRFDEAKVVDFVDSKAIEAAYNYYGIEPQKISEQIMPVVLSLVFYVIYTLWYGFAILFMFEGSGFRLEH